MNNKKIQKILLLNPPSLSLCQRDYYCSHTTKGDYLWQPYDLQIMSSFLKMHHLFFIDAVAGGFDCAYCLERIKQIKPDIVISQIGNATFKEDITFLKSIKKNIDTTIIITGDVTRSMYDRLLNDHPFLDALIYNTHYSEITKFVQDRDVIEPINIITGKYKNIRRCKEYFKTGIPVMKFFKHRRYSLPHSKKGPLYTLSSSFGCPYSCQYCHFEKIESALRDPEDLYKELCMVKKYGFKQLHFRDQTFGYDKEHRKEILDILKRFDFSSIVYTRADILDEYDIKEFKKAGIDFIEIGVESEVHNIRTTYGKNISDKKYIEFFRSLKKNDINSLATFVLGLNKDEINSGQKKLEFIKKLAPDIISLNLLAKKPGTTLCSNQSNYENMDPSKGDSDSETLRRLQKDLYFKYYFSATYIFQQIKKIKSQDDIIRHLKNALGFFRTFS